MEVKEIVYVRFLEFITGYLSSKSYKILSQNCRNLSEGSIVQFSTNELYDKDILKNDYLRFEFWVRKIEGVCFEFKYCSTGNPRRDRDKDKVIESIQIIEGNSIKDCYLLTSKEQKEEFEKLKEKFHQIYIEKAIDETIKGYELTILSKNKFKKVFEYANL